ncbi:MAG TPA: hypothetical protein EYQ86_01145 [Bacteroidetes bacterium]|nr:hypothetical protein [Bacteroidota bacterium]
MPKRTNPLTNKRVRLVSFWSDHIKTDNRGEANYEIDIPEYSGSLRIMGVAYKDKAFGSAEKNMIVADPIVISTALPRFSSPMDTFLVPVNLANTLNKTTTAKVSISSVGALEIVGSVNEEIELNPKSDNYAYFLIAAKPEIGYSTVTVSVKAHNETFTSTTNMTVRPPSSLVKQSGSKTIKAGKSSKINLSSDFIALESKIIISTSPMVQFAKDLDYLVGYPHGCLEQTTSKSFPQLYFSDLTKSLKMKRKVNKSYNTEYFVQEGIKKIESMQVYNGGFSYWRGGSYHWWGSSYATHFLLEAKKAGYEVNDHVLNKVLDNLSQRVKQRINTYEYDYRATDGMWYKKLIYPREALYSLYVLAISGRYEISTMNFFKENRDKLSLDSKYLLACTYALAGKNEDYKNLLPSKFFGEESKKDSYRSFSSPVRDKALALNALIEINPEQEQVASLAQELSKDLKTRRYLSTQERAFAFLALGKLSKMTKNNNVKARILADGEEVAVFDGKDLVINKGIENKMVNIKTEGTGYLYVYHYTEGISVSGNIKEVDNLMQVRRQYYNRDGKIINQKNIQQNDLIVVQVSARTTNGSSIKNVAITDLLPAGLEIENPRLSTNLNLSWKPRNSRHDAMDVRDDRITYFTTLNSNWKRYHYVVRAVSKGKYKLGPVSGDAMYDGEYHSYNGAGEVVIK